MDLVTPELGLIFWTALTFIVLLFLLTKFAWKPILGAVETREKNIQESLDLAKKTKAEMEQLKSQNENLLKEARIERDEMIKEAKETKNRMISEAKEEAKVEAEKVLANAKAAFETEKNKAIADLRNQVAGLSIEIAEKILRDELSSKEAQTKMANDFVNDINLN